MPAQVLLTKVKRLAQQGRIDSAVDLTPTFWLLEVTTIVHEGQHINAANAIGGLLHHYGD